MIESVCKQIHAWRRAGRLTEGRVFELGRELGLACGTQVAGNGGYSPENDRRVWWARRVLAAALGGGEVAAPDASLEGVALMLLGLDGGMGNTCGRGATDT
jgi:hypothetical protein